MQMLMVFHASLCPPVIGPSRSTYVMLRELLREHDVTVLSFGTAEQEARFAREFGSACRTIFLRFPRPRCLAQMRRVWWLLTGRSDFPVARDRRLQHWLDHLAATEHFDLIGVSCQMMGSYRFPAGTPLLTDTHNVEFEYLRLGYREATDPIRKLAYWARWRATRRDELALLRKFDLVLAVSEADRQVFARALPPQRIAVIPNGIDLAQFKPPPVEPERHTLMFSGLMSYYPNDHGIRWFIERIFPRVRDEVPDARLLVVGAHPSRKLRGLAGRGVEVTGYVPRIQPYFARAQVVVAPLRMGGGTRVKLLEAMAMRRPVVSTTFGAAGLAARDGRHLLLADTPAAFARAVVNLLRDPRVAASLVAQAAALVADEYPWDAIGRRLRDACARLAPRLEARSALASRSAASPNG